MIQILITWFNMKCLALFALLAFVSPLNGMQNDSQIILGQEGFYNILIKCEEYGRNIRNTINENKLTWGHVKNSMAEFARFLEEWKAYQKLENPTVNAAIAENLPFYKPTDPVFMSGLKELMQQRNSPEFTIAKEIKAILMYLSVKGDFLGSYIRAIQSISPTPRDERNSIAKVYNQMTKMILRYSCTENMNSFPAKTIEAVNYLIPTLTVKDESKTVNASEYHANKGYGRNDSDDKKSPETQKKSKTLNKQKKKKKKFAGFKAGFLNARKNKSSSAKSNNNQSDPVSDEVKYVDRYQNDVEDGSYRKKEKKKKSTKSCAWCHVEKSEETELYLCKGCLSVRYCSRNHEKRDWNSNHRNVCNKNRVDTEDSIEPKQVSEDIRSQENFALFAERLQQSLPCSKYQRFHLSAPTPPNESTSSLPNSHSDGLPVDSEEECEDI
eukprot:875650_1